jgi:hypothetical protein
MRLHRKGGPKVRLRSKNLLFSNTEDFSAYRLYYRDGGLEQLISNGGRFFSVQIVSITGGYKPLSSSMPRDCIKIEFIYEFSPVSVSIAVRTSQVFLWLYCMYKKNPQNEECFQCFADFLNKIGGGFFAKYKMQLNTCSYVNKIIQRKAQTLLPTFGMATKCRPNPTPVENPRKL